MFSRVEHVYNMLSVVSSHAQCANCLCPVMHNVLIGCAEKTVQIRLPLPRPHISMQVIDT